jgi:probable phosphomutase (TIGR03848 family)
MPIVLLIRHAENQYVKKGKLAGRLPGVLLNDHGLQQSQMLAENLVKMPLKAIYSSPLERALQTAEPLAKTHQLEIIKRPGLIETDYGDWEGKTLKALQRRKLWRLVQHAPTRVRFPGGESFAETQLRIVQEIQELVNKHMKKDAIACVSHADPIKLAIAYFLGMPLDLFQRLTISPASITTIHMSAFGVQLLNINYDPALVISKH